MAKLDMNEKTCLYRHFNESNKLLYVGISRNVVNRIAGHKNSTWHHEIFHVSVEWFPDRKTALAAEAKAIVAEKPIYNKLHAPKALKREQKTKPAAEPAGKLTDLDAIARQSKAGRGLLGWNQGELAKRANIGIQTVKNFESGRPGYSQQTFIAIRNAMEAEGLVFSLERTNGELRFGVIERKAA